MRKVKLDNDDLIQYMNTIKALKKYPTMTEYRDEYRRIRTDGSPLSEAKKFKSAHTELLRLDRKKKSIMSCRVRLLKNQRRSNVSEYRNSCRNKENHVQPEHQPACRRND